MKDFAPSDACSDVPSTDAFPWDEAPEFMIRDRDGCYGQVVTKRLAAMGIRDHPIAPRVNRNAFVSDACHEGPLA